LITIKEVKDKYIIELGAKEELKIENLRLFCFGRELKDELYVYSYDIKDEMVI